jgi:hypothetical protein
MQTEMDTQLGKIVMMEMLLSLLQNLDQVRIALLNHARPFLMMGTAQVMVTIGLIRKALGRLRCIVICLQMVEGGRY